MFLYTYSTKNIQILTFTSSNQKGSSYLLIKNYTWTVHFYSYVLHIYVINTVSIHTRILTWDFKWRKTGLHTYYWNNTTWILLHDVGAHKKSTSYSVLNFIRIISNWFFTLLVPFSISILQLNDYTRTYRLKILYYKMVIGIKWTRCWII